MGTTAEPFTKRYTIKFTSEPLTAPMGRMNLPVAPGAVREKTIRAASDEHAAVKALLLCWPGESVEITAEDGRKVPV